jgi:hypothetical protein
LSLLIVAVDDASLIHPTFSSTSFYMQVHPSMAASGQKAVIKKNGTSSESDGPVNLQRLICNDW